VAEKIQAASFPRPFQLVDLRWTGQPFRSRVTNVDSPRHLETHRPHRGASDPIHPHAPHSRRRIFHHATRCSHRVPSTGLSKDRLSVTVAVVAPHPTPLARCFGTRCHPCAESVLVVPPHPDGFRSDRFAGLLRPASDHEVHCVSAPAVPPRWWSVWSFPSSASPSRAFPPVQPYPRRREPRAPSPFGLPPVDLEALLHTRDRCLMTPFPTPRGPQLSWASHPGATSLPLPLRAPEGTRLGVLPRFHRRPTEIVRLLPRGESCSSDLLGPTRATRPRRVLVPAGTLRVPLRRAEARRPFRVACADSCFCHPHARQHALSGCVAAIRRGDGWRERRRRVAPSPCLPW
jgi:hypothetical protein